MASVVHHREDLHPAIGSVVEKTVREARKETSAH